jgi:hypothetical protein
MDVVAVDWSGAAKNASVRIWLAHVVDGELVALRNGRTRHEVIDDLVALRSQTPQGLVAGLDFSFSFPSWFMWEQSCATVDDMWRLASREGESWLSDCPLPFWGRPGRPRPALPAHLRLAEASLSQRGVSPKSVFQIGGAGTVGTGSVRGMPHLRRLRASGFSIWPFDPASPWTVLEIYPRLCTGPVNKSNLEQRARHLEASPWEVPDRFAASIVGSEDAFDAAISALVMHDHLAHLAALQQTTDPVTLLEGDVWRPPKITPMSQHEDESPAVSSGSGAPSPGDGSGVRPTLTAQVRRRRTDQQFFLRLRDAIQQNHRALERLGT